MGKVLKAVAVIAIAVAVAYFAPQLLPSALAFLGTATAAAITTAVVSTAIAMAVTTGISLLAGKPSTASAAPSVFRQSISNSFIIYGKRRVGGLLIFFHPIGKDWRYFVIAVAGHRCMSCPLLSGPSTMTVWIKEGTTNACQEAQARGDHREAA